MILTFLFWGSTVLFWGSIFTLFYIYFGYPLLLTLWAKLFGAKKIAKQMGFTPSVTFVVPAHNEAAVIGKKLAALKTIEYPNFDILVSCDGCDDGTVDIATAAVGAENVIEEKNRKGKTNIINKSAAAARGDIIIFTDASVILKPDVATHLTSYFADPKVGCVGGQLVHLEEGETQTTESVSLFRRYENLLRIGESSTGSMIGADGSLFAIRRELFEPWPEYLIDDFSTSVNILTQGYRVVYSPESIGYEAAAKAVKTEFRRKIRISNRTITACLYLCKKLKTLSLVNIFKLCSHRILRYSSAYFMVIALISNLILAVQFPILYGPILGLHLLFYFLSGLAYMEVLTKENTIGKLANTALYFTLANYACAIGVFRALSGKKVTIWRPTTVANSGN